VSPFPNLLQPVSRYASTKIGDLAYVTNETARVAEISTKTYADAVALNLTDVRCLCSVALPYLDDTLGSYAYPRIL
jgi:hypothetical protein